MTRSLSVGDLRHNSTRIFVILLWCQVPLMILLGLATDNGGIAAAIVDALAAAAATVMARLSATSPATRYTVSSAMAVAVTVWVAMCAGTPYQVEAHFLFFIIGGMLLAYVCWVSLALVGLLVAVHHLSFNAFLPALIFPGGTDWVRFLIHAAAWAAFIGFGLWMSVTLARVFASMDAAVADADSHARDLERLTAERDAASHTAERQRKDDLAALATRFEGAVSGATASVALSANMVEEVATTMTDVAIRAAAKTADASRATDSAAASVHEAASATGAMAATVGEVGRQVSESAHIAKSAVQEAERTNEIVLGLAGAAQRIGDVVKLINDIAAQTNLLALNATIEAARAGEAGKGFAVVANEVKSLANQTAKATEEIAQQVGTVQSETGRAVDAIRHVGDTIRRIDEIAAHIAAAVEEQTAVTGNISRSVEIAAASANEVRDLVADVTSMVEQAGASSQDLLSASRQMSGESGQLKQTVETFVGSLRN
ncbi:MAG: chemotaxis protein [Magnetospirillum sp.]|nr:chemotaxis protein [Magnetospirillum sp.]